MIIQKQKQKMIVSNPLRLTFLLAALLVTVPPAVAQPGVTAPVGGSGKSATAALTLTSATAAIQSCAFEARSQLLFDLDNRLKIVAAPLHDLANSAKALPEASQERITAALDELKLQEGVLRQGMEAAQQATARNWPQARATLAVNYLDYIGAVSRLEVLVQGNKGG